MFLWPRHSSAPGPHGSKLQKNHSKWQTKGTGIRAQFCSMGLGQISQEGRQCGHGAEDQHLLDVTMEMSLQPNPSACLKTELVLIPRVCLLSLTFPDAVDDSTFLSSASRLDPSHHSRPGLYIQCYQDLSLLPIPGLLHPSILFPPLLYIWASEVH